MLFEYDVPGDRWFWSSGLRELHGLAPGADPTTDVLIGHVVEDEQDAARRKLVEYSTTPGCYSFAYRMRDNHRHLRHLRFVCQSEAVGWEVKRLHGFIVDVTDTMRGHADQAVAHAVEHRAVIEQAKGALMVSFGIDDAAAFELLRGYSSRTNTKLVTVAEHIAKGLSDPRFSREEPVRSLLDILLELEGQEALTSAFDAAPSEPARPFSTA